MTKNSEKKEKILSILDNTSIQESIEILGNVMLELGIQNTSITKKLNPQEIASAVVDDLKLRGETLGNALARQALIMLTWTGNKGK